MANVLNLKDPDTYDAEDELEDGVEPEQEPEFETSDDDESPVAELASPDEEEDDDNPYPDEVAWRVSVRPGELERRKEHIMMAFLAGVSVLGAYWLKSMPLVLIAGLTVVAWEVHHRAHEEADVHINTKGVRINEYRHAFAKLASFSIQELPDRTWHLSIKHISGFTPDIRVPLGSADHEEVRVLLTNYIDEEDHPIPISELFLKS